MLLLRRLQSLFRQVQALAGIPHLVAPAVAEPTQPPEAGQERGREEDALAVVVRGKLCPARPSQGKARTHMMPNCIEDLVPTEGTNATYHECYCSCYYYYYYDCDYY